MAEGVVNFVVDKLGDVFVKELLHLYGVNGQVEKVNRELRYIQAFVNDANQRRILDERQKYWVNEMRDLAYWIEDVIDTFLVGVQEKKPGKREALRRRFTKNKILLRAIHRLGAEINQIEARIQEIQESRERFGISNLDEVIVREIRPPFRLIVLPDIDEADFVGFEEDKEKIVKLLLNESVRRRSVISIVGTGGLGKTALARKVYNSEEIKRQFHIRVWVVMSQKYELVDIVQNIAEQLKIEPPKDLSEYQLTELYQSLAEKRYLIVLDEIWNNNPWTQIEGIFPDKNNMSRVLITTRFLTVAEEADPRSVPHKLPFLTKEQSLELLMKKALPNRNANELYSHNLNNIGEQFVNRCGGLPIALMVLGNLLSVRAPTYNAWSSFMETVDWSTVGKECLLITGTSYEDLPFVLQSCFMYLAAFPKDYEVDARSLIRMWVAEGFIPREENRTLEDTAHSFLEDLVQRSMIQVSKRSFDGSIAFCRIHVIMHDLAIQKAKENNFLMAYAKIEDLKNCNQMRCMALHDSSFYFEDEEAKELNGIRAIDRIAARRKAEELYGESIASATPNLRSLLCFHLLPKISQLMLLKVLSDTGRTKSVHELEKFGELSVIRYVELSLVIYSIKDMETFQKFIGGMRFLQTLDLRSGIIRGDLPDCVWFVKTLRHVLLPKRPGLISGPPPSVDLEALQTLFVVQCRELWETAGLPKLPNVRTLGIRLWVRFHWDIIFSLLGTLNHLTSLEIVGGSVPLHIIDMRPFPFYHRLQNLDLENENWRCHKKIALAVGMFPINLTTLRLQYLQFSQDPMPVLEQLEKLRSLFLGGSKFAELSNSAGGFSELEELEFFKLEELKEWRIQEGAMPKLKELKVSNCPLLRVPPGLQHLTVLQKLTWDSWNSYGKMDKTIKNEILNICKHVPSNSIIVGPM